MVERGICQAISTCKLDHDFDQDYASIEVFLPPNGAFNMLQFETLQFWPSGDLYFGRLGLHPQKNSVLDATNYRPVEAPVFHFLESFSGRADLRG